MSAAISVFDAAPGVNPQAPIARANPLTKLAVSMIVTLGLILSVDLVSAGTALALLALALPWCGLSPRALWRRGWVVLVGAIPAGVATAVFGRQGGEVLLEVGPLSISQNSATMGAAIVLRLLAIALPGVILLATTDPIDLATALSTRARVPARFVLPALVALRLVGVMTQEWHELGLARRARGIGGGGPVARLREGASRIFALLVLALRRAAVLSTTMESRGFGSTRARTWSRQSRFGWRDAALVVGALSVVAVSIWAAVQAGTWNPIYY